MIGFDGVQSTVDFVDVLVALRGFNMALVQSVVEGLDEHGDFRFDVRLELKPV